MNAENHYLKPETRGEHFYYNATGELHKATICVEQWCWKCRIITHYFKSITDAEREARLAERRRCAEIAESAVRLKTSVVWDECSELIAERIRK